ncbi:hypothetical protein [Actinomadura madurae]|uniref:hypothetical protein n=1 Tax=Actinomadura madurae TaxID=1993 RepID=UPI001FD11EE6|nr:hypothetical protein [Actinomadura madurae]
MRDDSRDWQHSPPSTAQQRGTSQDASHSLQQHWHASRMRVRDRRTSRAVSFPQ